MTIDEFCDLYGACDDGRKWALENCTSLAEAWGKAPAEFLIWAATREGVLADRELRKFACWSVRQVWHLLTDERSRHAVEIAERHANGCATNEELAAAGDAAGDAAWSAVRAAVRAAAMAAARAAARDAARDAARAAARAASSDAAGDAACFAARDAAWDAARDAARAAARDAQADWIRKNCRPEMLRQEV